MSIRATVSAWKDDPSKKYHTLLCAVGYETRSRFAAERVFCRAAHRVAIGFDYHHACALKENVDWFSQHGFFDWNDGEPSFASDQDFEAQITNLLNLRGSDPEAILQFAVDISSFSSVRIAAVVECLWNVAELRDIEIDFLYAPGKNYVTVCTDDPIEFAGPVSRRLAGWSSEPDLPVVAIFGLGLEYDRSIGAHEYLNPSLTYTFATHGANAELERQIASEVSQDDDWGKRIAEANKQLLPLVPPDQRFSFDVGRPLDCYNIVRSVAVGSVRYGRTVFVPLGPKLFTLCAVLVANELYPTIAVWRISNGRQGDPYDILPSGDLFGIRVRLRKVN